MLIKEIMTKDVVTVSPDTSIKEIARILKEKKISGIPVVDALGEIIGIVTISDIMRVLKEIYQWQELETKLTGLKVIDAVGKETLHKEVKTIMTEEVITLDEDSTLHEALHLMFSKNIHTFPVIAQNGKLAGVVGKHDLIYASSV